MNRTIKFRGRIVDSKEWVYGSLVVYPDGECNILTCRNNHSPKMDDWLVDVSTIGQFTGLEYKGIKVYEHDVFRFKDEYYEVVYNESIAAFAFLNIATQRVGVVPFVNMLAVVTMEHIGNIHDDTELIRI